MGLPAVMNTDRRTRQQIRLVKCEDFLEPREDDKKLQWQETQNKIVIFQTFHLSHDHGRFAF